MRTTTVLFLITLLTGCATTPQSGSYCAVEPEVLATQVDFAWRGEPTVNDTTGYVSPIMVRDLNTAVSQELVRKGFQFTSDAPLTVQLTLNLRREVVSINVAGSPCTGPDCGDPIDFGPETDVVTATVGFLAADIFLNNEPVWRGWVEQTLYPKDREQFSTVIANAVPELLKDFPPQ